VPRGVVKKRAALPATEGHLKGVMVKRGGGMKSVGRFGPWGGGWWSFIGNLVPFNEKGEKKVT